MGKRIAIMAGATVLAAAVLLATLFSDTPDLATPDTPRIGADAATPDAPKITERDIRRTPDRPEAGPIATGQYQVERLTNGKLWQFTGQRVTPLPQGLMRVEQPGMRMHMERWRVLEITADRGLFVAPGNQPRSGDFEGNVVVTLFESPTAAAPDMSEKSPHVQLRLFLDEASFDVELGQIDSTGPVHLTGPTVDFVGTGLRINHNARRNRIERLEVARGDTLRIKPRAMQDQPKPQREGATPWLAPTSESPRVDVEEPEADAPDTVDDVEQRRRQRAERQREREREAQAATAPPQQEGPQFYRATFERDVRIHSPRAVVAADSMQVLFSLDDDMDRPPARTLGPAPLPERLSPSALGAVMPVAGHLLALQWTAPTQGRPNRPALPVTTHPTLAPVADDDVIITWQGKLIVTPEAAVPDHLDGPGDRMVILRGSPVRIDAADGQTATAARVDYAVNRRRIGMESDEHHPLVVRDPASGELRGASLVIDQSAQVGHVIGPGSLHAVTPDAEGPDAQPLHITWADRLDMTFFGDDQSDQTLDEPTSLKALRTADFRGKVDARHPQFNLTGDRVAVGFTPPTGQPQSLQRLDAEGDVQLRAAGNGDQPALALDAQKLAIDMTRGADGQAVPTQLAAEERVKVVLPSQSLWSHKLNVGLAAGKDGRMEVTTLRAEDDVRADMKSADGTDGQGVAALAHLLIANATTGEAELFGNAQRMASLVREDGELTGQRILLYEASRQVHVPGAGSLTFVARTAGQEAATDPTHLHVTWAEAMRFDDVAGTAAFVGDVVAATASAHDRTRLTARELHLDFADTPQADRPDADAMNALLGGQREIRRLSAVNPQGDGEAVFLAVSHPDGANHDDPDAPIDTRFRLAGPSIVFTNPDERVTVTGKGSMLIEDYRGLDDQAQKPSPPPTPDPAASAANQPTDSPVASGPPIPSSLRQPKPDASPRPTNASSAAVTGKGQTLFTWTGSLQLDAKENDLLIRDNVLMLHRSPQRGSVVQLNCDRLAADQQASGGLSTWLSGTAPRPQVQTVKADGSVKIREATTTILADHAHYDGKSDFVNIFADGQRLVTVLDDAEPLGQLTARKLRWNLATNRFEVIGPGPGRAPMGIQRRVD